MPFEIIRNDITEMKVDAIVNAANSTLLGGGGVDGAIHRAAGPELLRECRALGGCETGQAKLTRGYRLPCRYVIHTVGPVWQGGKNNEKELLTACYLNSLRLAAEHGCETVAFPLISAGAYGYPREEAFRVAEDAVREFLFDHDMTVYLVIFDRQSFLISRRLYDRIQAYIDDAYVGPLYEEEEKHRRAGGNMLSVGSPAAPKMKAHKKASPRKARVEKESAPLLKDTECASVFMDAKCAQAPAPALSLQEYLSRQDEGFRDMLLRKIDESGMTDAECYKKANVDRKLFNKIKLQQEYRPGKNIVLAFAVALRLTLGETEEMLGKAGFSLTHSSKFDLIVEYFIMNGNYDLFEINQALFSFDQKLLGSMM